MTEASPLGFAPEQVAALVQGSRQARLEWVPGSLPYGPESGQGDVAAIAARSGGAELVRIDVEKSAADCEDYVRMPFEMTLSSGGGALDESFLATVVAKSASEASVTRTLPSEGLRGGLAFEPDALGGLRFFRLELNLRFREKGFAGFLFAGIEGGDESSGSVSYQALPLACWGELPYFPRCPD